MPLKPLSDRLIVKRSAPVRTSAGGIVLPDAAGEKPEQGTVVAVGPGRTDDNGRAIPIGVKVGDTILFGKYAGQTVKVDAEELLVIREEEVFAIVE